MQETETLSEVEAMVGTLTFGKISVKPAWGRKDILLDVDDYLLELSPTSARSLRRALSTIIATHRLNPGSEEAKHIWDKASNALRLEPQSLNDDVFVTSFFIGTTECACLSEVALKSLLAELNEAMS